MKRKRRKDVVCRETPTPVEKKILERALKIRREQEKSNG
jgi:hypothetical protein